MGFRIKLDNKATIKKCSDNGVISGQNREYQVATPDPETGTYKGWFIVQKVNMAVTDFIELKYYQPVPEEDRLMKFYLVQNGMLYVEFEGITEEQASSRIDIDLVTRALDTTKFSYKISSNDPDFLTPESKIFLTGYQDNGTNDSKLTTTILTRQDRQFKSLKVQDFSTLSYTMNEEKTRATVDSSIGYDVYITAETEQRGLVEIVEKNITQRGANITTDYTDTTVVVGEEYTINFIASSGYRFIEQNPIKLSYTENGLPQNLYGQRDTQDPTKASITFVAPNSDIEISGTVEQIKKFVDVEVELNNCTVQVDNITYNNGDIFQVVEDDTIEFTFIADQGFEFEEIGTVRQGVREDNQGGVTSSFTPTDKTQFTKNITIRFYGSGSTSKTVITLGAKEETPEIVGELGSFVNIYKVTGDDLKELSKVRFVKISGTTGVESVDYGKYINSIYYLPFELDPEVVTPTKSTNIILGELDTDIVVHGILKPKVMFNMGSITINEKYNNVYDYKNTECILYLPFNDPINLNTEYCINQTITINYIVDFYSGDTTVNIYSTLTNNLIYSTIVNVSQHIPFLTSDVSIIDKRNPQLNNTVSTPFIEVTRNIPYNVNSLFGKPVIDYGQLNSFTGYVEVENVILNVNCTENEKEQIKNILTSGINIKWYPCFLFKYLVQIRW